MAKIISEINDDDMIKSLASKGIDIAYENQQQQQQQLILTNQLVSNKSSLIDYKKKCY